MVVLPGRLPPADMYPAGEPGLRERFVRLASGLTVRVVEAGAPGAPPVVFVPGWACGAWIFHANIPALAKAGFHAMAVELKGHGLSDKPTSPAAYTLDSMRDHLLEILDALALPRAALAGHSMGAVIAAQAAAAAPDRVAGLALIAPVGFAGVRGMRLFRALTPVRAVPLLARISSRFLVWLMLVVVYRLRLPRGRDVDQFRAPTQFPEFALALRHLLHEFDWESSLPHFAVPWMVVLGTRDHLSPVKDASRYAGAHSSVVVPGAGHVILDEAPEKVNAALAGFFGTVFGVGYISTDT